MEAILELFNMWGYITKVEFRLNPDILIEIQVNQIAENFSKLKLATLNIRKVDNTIQVFTYRPNRKGVLTIIES